jgi:alpha,alpha-trehalase
LTIAEELRPAFHQNLRAACESGWDFSSRWFADGKNKTTVQCENFAPICLNSLLYNCEKQLATMYKHQSNFAKAKTYEILANTRKKAILNSCWSTDDKVFNDYNFVTQSHNPVISLATVYPLFFGIATQNQANQIAQTIERKFLAKGGVVTTLNTTGEQWDAPNGWAPLQYLTVIGLSRYGHNKLAKTIAKRWLALNEKEYQSEHKMMEKYNVIDTDLPGGGGNYDNQDGFGWTNGVDLALYKWLSGIKN